MKVIYPGSFDPLTLGHIDVIKRLDNMFDEVIVAILINEDKKSLFTLDEREEIIARGLRLVADYEYEKNIARINSSLYEGLETIFLLANTNYSFISSSGVKEVASFKGNISPFVTKNVEKRLKEKYNY